MSDLILLVPFSVLAIVFNFKILYLAKQDNYDQATYWFSTSFSINLFMGILLILSIALFAIPKNFLYPGTALLILWFGTVPFRIYICYKNYLRTERVKDLFFILLAGFFAFIAYWKFLMR